MPNDFSATLLVPIQKKLEMVFLGGRTAQERAFTPETAAKLMQNQTATVTQLFRGDECVGHEVAYLYSDNAVAPTVSATPIAPACIIAAGDTLSSAKKVFNPNLYIRQALTINDKDCDNVLKFVDKAAFGFASKMAQIADELNVEIINRLVANAMTPTFVGNGTLNANIIEYAASEFDPDLLADWDSIAINNLLPQNYLVLHGNNFRNQYYNAAFQQLNDNQRSFLPQLFMGGRASWDMLRLDQTVGAPTSFLVDPNMYAFFSRSVYTDTMVNLGDQYNTQVFRMPLQYTVNNGMNPPELKTMMYANGAGDMVPVYLDVRYQKICNTAGDGGRVSMTHNWEFSLEADFDIAPSSDATSGIIQIEKV